MDLRDFSDFAELMPGLGEEHVLSSDLSHSGKALVTDVRVPGRILGKGEVYADIGAEAYIVETVQYGYKLEFDVEPPPSLLRNNNSALNDHKFVRSELQRLEDLGCIVRVHHRPRVTLPLSLVMSNKLRLVVDASRNLNPYCTRRGIKLEDLTHVASTVGKGDFMVVNDLDSGYWHVPIHPDHWTYLGSHFEEEDGSVIYWVWRVLCLGLRDAAHIFTRLIAPIMGELRRRGMHGLIYIDDLLVCGSSMEECLFWEKEAKLLFARAGWVFKPSKRSGEPSQVCKFLGLIVDSRDLRFYIPEDKICKIEDRCKELIKKKWVQARWLASAVGSMQSVRLATGPVVAALTRSLYQAVDDANYWNSFLRLDEMALQELRWWKENIRLVSGFPVDGKLSSVAVEFRAEVASDGSAVGHFSYNLDGGGRLAGRAFTEEERAESSTFRELLAFRDTWTDEATLRSFRGKRVTHYSDSKAMCIIVMKGSKNRKLQPLVVEALLALRSYGISMESAWLSREDGIIKIADLGSRDYHADDISVDFDTFLAITEQFGVFEVDCFAASHNKKADRFFSRNDVIGSGGVDFFVQKLRPEDNHWLFPLPGMLCQAVWHLQEQQVSGVILVPIWPKSSFYSFFWPDGRHPAYWVEAMLVVKPFFICGPLVTGRGLRGRRPFYSAVLKVSFLADRRSRGGGVNLRPDLCLRGGCHYCT
jgi:hypothetical protein